MAFQIGQSKILIMLRINDTFKLESLRETMAS